MSRHRFIRNLDLEDYRDEYDDFDEEDYEEDEDDDQTDDAHVQEAIAQIRDILGKDTTWKDEDIHHALEEHGMNLDRTMEALLQRKAPPSVVRPSSQPSTFLANKEKSQSSPLGSSKSSSMDQPAALRLRSLAPVLKPQQSTSSCEKQKPVHSLLGLKAGGTGLSLKSLAAESKTSGSLSSLMQRAAVNKNERQHSGPKIEAAPSRTIPIAPLRTLASLGPAGSQSRPEVVGGAMSEMRSQGDASSTALPPTLPSLNDIFAKVKIQPASAQPSPFADCLLAPADMDGDSIFKDTDGYSFFFTESVRNSGDQVKTFDFKTPSPDEVHRAVKEKKPAVVSIPAKMEKKDSTSSLAGSVKSMSVDGLLVANGSSESIAAKSSLKEETTEPSKPVLNLVAIGHVDAGKSTLMGHLLYLLGEVDERVIRKHERDSKNMGKGSFMYAWVLDETSEERERGVTIDVAVNQFETESRQFVLLDAPGHRDFIPNMISGASRADVAVLVVDAVLGAFEAGFEDQGQTKEHAFLARSLGVSHLIVAVNKMDAIEWNEDRFKFIQETVGQFLTQQVGYKSANITYVPCSGVQGDNLLKRKDLSWFTGPTLVEVLDALPAPQRLTDKPMRLSITDCFKGGVSASSGGVTVAGRIDQGTIQAGQKVVVMPGQTHCTVKVIERLGKITKKACAGDQVTMTLQGLEMTQVSVGHIVCTANALISVVQRFTAQIVVFNIKIPIIQGHSVIFHQQSYNEPAVIKKLIAIVKSTGEVLKNNPRALPRQSTAIVEIELGRGMCLERFRDSREFGRFMLRNRGETLAAGIITEI